MTVTLTNVSRRCLVFVLAHDVFCAARGRCACKGAAPSSLAVASGVSATIDDAVLSVPEVIRAVREGALRVKRGAA